ncbi:STAS domain-containing protein [Fontimonas thermophila]|uniref:STAS domain-containing protein n=1 Tax=Fontimonas thermophila TaxID=1076937 RepID=A0A1I2J2Z3_9GAMM|nr:STAS domain-containing protein [Fontimonas thermophila]SFF47306.1 STAS domain-containing protein [Fontimonas thermophila]
MTAKTQLTGELTQQRVPELLTQIGTLAAATEIDLSGVTRTDSAGLALLLEISRRSHHRPVRFVRAPEQLRALAQFFGIAALLRLT